MLQRCCFVDLCRLGTSVIYTAWFHTLHRSVSARQRAPWTPFRSMHTLVRLTPFWRTNGDKYNVTNLWSGAHRDTHRSSSRRRTKHSSLGAQDWLWLSAQPTPPFSLTVVSSGSSCRFHKTVCFSVLLFEGSRCHPDLAQLSAGCTCWLPHLVPIELNVFVCILHPLVGARGQQLILSLCTPDVLSEESPSITLFNWGTDPRYGEGESFQAPGQLHGAVCHCFAWGSLLRSAFHKEYFFVCLPRRSAQRVALRSGFCGSSFHHHGAVAMGALGHGWDGTELAAPLCTTWQLWSRGLFSLLWWKQRWLGVSYSCQ